MVSSSCVKNCGLYKETKVDEFRKMHLALVMTFALDISILKAPLLNHLTSTSILQNRQSRDYFILKIK